MQRVRADHGGGARCRGGGGGGVPEPEGLFPEAVQSLGVGSGKGARGVPRGLRRGVRRNREGRTVKGPRG